jgi:hypothetical protein
MVMAWDQNAGRSHSMKIDNSSIERVEEFKYLGTTFVRTCSGSGNYIYWKGYPVNLKCTDSSNTEDH